MPEPQILAMGGFPDDTLLDHALGLARGDRVLYVPTAVRDDPDQIVYWYGRLRERGTMTHLTFFPWPPTDLRKLVLTQDVILVSGGNTANAL
ncbi:MAG: Type 1 glutamine amidotransferase-like domain-containing protein, partial [Gaiellaceae bacterium]